MRQLLLIDDDERLASPLQTFFQQYDFELLSQTDPLQALDWLQQHSVDMIILDVMLPHIDGFETCRRIRQFSDIPIIMLTARGDVMDRVVGLEIGADDYLPKPFEPRELVARIQNILRRSKSGQEGAQTSLRFDGLVINQQTQQVSTDDRILELTSAEYRLLLLLASQHQRIFSRDDIMHELNGVDADIYSRAIDILVSRLRQKLKPLDAIKTIRSRGYQFVLPPQAGAS
ncbi:MAG: response regulator transcription factor [Gammaproteobacteria bacterium]|nr:response regulator transcription factor [Gammaproteobacteria bacterium]